MATFFQIVSLTLIVVIACTAQQQCDDHQIYTTCGSSCPEYCNWDFTVSCSDQCVPGCFCKPGYVLLAADSNHCLPVEDCENVPKCGPNQQYLTCGSRCPDYCGKPDDIACIEVCTPGCFCKSGYIFSGDASGKCIEIGTCPL